MFPENYGSRNEMFVDTLRVQFVNGELGHIG